VAGEELGERAGLAVGELSELGAAGEPVRQNQCIGMSRNGWQ
jgi:hypothetical protein